jgi:sialate O-acetylesterase
MKLKTHQFAMLLVIAVLISLTAFSQVRLSKLISDGMVVERNSKVKIWGWAAHNEQVTIQFLDSTYHTKADSNIDV